MQEEKEIYFLVTSHKSKKPLQIFFEKENPYRFEKHNSEIEQSHSPEELDRENHIDWIH